MTEQLKSYGDRLNEFKKVRLRILNILHLANKPLTHPEILERYVETYRHSALIDNRLRGLRADGEVVNDYPRDGYKTWRLSEQWKPKPK